MNIQQVNSTPMTMLHNDQKGNGSFRKHHKILFALALLTLFILGMLYVQSNVYIIECWKIDQSTKELKCRTFPGDQCFPGWNPFPPPAPCP
jgi:hypothetical protein